MSDLWSFLKVRKKWWLAPVIFSLVLLGVLSFSAETNVFAQVFLYPF